MASSPEACARKKVRHPVSAPAGCRAEPSGGQDPPDGACAYAVAESGEFALDRAVAPGGALPCQAQHQGPDFVGDGWAA